MKLNTKMTRTYLNIFLVLLLIFTLNSGVINATEGQTEGGSPQTFTQETENTAGTFEPGDLSEAEVVQGSGNTGNSGNATVHAPTEVIGILNQITNILAVIAGFVCLFKIIQIGIMFLLTGANERSNAKTALLPWIIGTAVCGGYIVLGNAVISIMQSASGGGIFGGGSPEDAAKTIGEQALSVIGVVAGAVAVGMIVYIGIKYMFSGAGGMAKVKTNLLPWLIGLILIAASSAVVDTAKNIIGRNGGDLTNVAKEAANSILGLLAIVAGAAAVGMLVYIGIKYMTRGAGGRAEVKNTILPWLIGAILVSSASGIVRSILSISGGGGAAGGTGGSGNTGINRSVMVVGYNDVESDINAIN